MRDGKRLSKENKQSTKVSFPPGMTKESRGNKMERGMNVAPALPRGTEPPKSQAVKRGSNVEIS
jgi:hypothetical protein